MEGFASDINIDGVETVVLDGNPFGVKYRIECGEQPVKGFLIYSKDEKPDDEDNWLLDIQEEGEIFAADMSSIYAAECGIPFELKSAIIDRHSAEWYECQ